MSNLLYLNHLEVDRSPSHFQDSADERQSLSMGNLLEKQGFWHLNLQCFTNFLLLSNNSTPSPRPALSHHCFHGHRQRNSSLPNGFCSSFCSLFFSIELKLAGKRTRLIFTAGTHMRFEKNNWVWDKECRKSLSEFILVE